MEDGDIKAFVLDLNELLAKYGARIHASVGGATVVFADGSWVDLEATPPAIHSPTTRN